MKYFDDKLEGEKQNKLKFHHVTSDENCFMAMVPEKLELIKTMSTVRHPSALQFYAAARAVWNSPLIPFRMPSFESFLNRPRFDINPPTNVTINSSQSIKSSLNEDSNDDRGA